MTNRKRISIILPSKNQSTYKHDDPFQTMHKPQEVARGKSMNNPFQPLDGSIRLKVVFIIGSAMVIGMMMGLVVLSVFSNLGEEQAGSNGTRSPAIIDDGDHDENDDMQELPPSEQSEIGSIQERSYYAIQAGVFEDEQAAHLMLEGLNVRGYAGLLLQENDTFRLYLGISPVRDDVQQVATYLEQQGIETYIREHVSSPLSQSVTQQHSNILTYAGLLDQADSLLAQFTAHAAHTLQGNGQALSDDNWMKLQNEHLRLLTTGESLLDDWDGQQRQLVENLLHHLSTGLNALQAYRQQPHDSYLWQVQQAGLQYVQTSVQLSHHLNAS